MKRAGKQTDLTTGLGRLLGSLDRKSGGAWRSTRVSRAWEEVAGPTVLSHTADAHIREGELVVAVDSPVWATELSALAEMYRERLNEHLGQETVRSVRFTVSRRVERKREIQRVEEEDASFYAPEDVERIPLTPAEYAQIAESAAQIPDDGLREAVIRATVADFELKKGRKAANSREKPREGL